MCYADVLLTRWGPRMTGMSHGAAVPTLLPRPGRRGTLFPGPVTRLLSGWADEFPCPPRCALAGLRRAMERARGLPLRKLFPSRVPAELWRRTSPNAFSPLRVWPESSAAGGPVLPAWCPVLVCVRVTVVSLLCDLQPLRRAACHSLGRALTVPVAFTGRSN